jgi:hypothetical protein
VKGYDFKTIFIITVLKSIEKLKDTKEIIRSLTSKDRQYTGQKRQPMDDTILHRKHRQHESH